MFEEVKKNFGFGCMRLPMNGDAVDYAEFSKMVDVFIAEGFNYFDTAHGYLDGKSEIALRECLTKRYPRESYLLTNKLTDDYFNKKEDIRPFFESQLKACGVEYFDFYLMHAQTAEYFAKYKVCSAYETAFELKKEGKIRHVGISFHDSAEVLDTILTEYPEVEAVQIQFNYVDYDDAGIQGRKCYEVCRKHNKPVIVMEPVKGGTLVNLPEDGANILKEVGCGSSVSYAIRYAASFDGVFMVLSGMSNMEQMTENIGFMKDFQKLNAKEFEAVQKVAAKLRESHEIACTGCRYCVSGCPKRISIPDLFADLNAKKRYKDWNSDFYYTVHTSQNGKASACIECGKCERICPQHLEIRKHLKTVAETFENQAE